MRHQRQAKDQPKHGIRHLNALVTTYSVVRPQDLKQIWDEDIVFSRGTSQFQQLNGILSNISLTPASEADARSADFRYWISGFNANGKQSVEVFIDGSIDNMIAGSNVLALESQEKMRRLLKSLVWEKRAQSQSAKDTKEYPFNVVDHDLPNHAEKALVHQVETRAGNDYFVLFSWKIARGEYDFALVPIELEKAF